MALIFSILPTTTSWTTLKQHTLYFLHGISLSGITCFHIYSLIYYCFSTQGCKLSSIRDFVCVVHRYILSSWSRTWQIIGIQQIFVEWGNELDKGNGYFRQRSEPEQNSEVWNCLCAWENLCFQWLKPKEENRKRWEQEVGIFLLPVPSFLPSSSFPLLLKYYVTMSCKYLGVNVV